MTTPVSGHPDYQQIVHTQSTSLLASYSNNLAPGQHFGTVFPTGSWSSVAVEALSGAGAATVSVRFWFGPGRSNLLSAYTWSLPNVGSLHRLVPVRGPFASVDINVTSAGNFTGSTFACFLSSFTDRVTSPNKSQTLSDLAHVLAASTTKQYNAGIVAPGLAQFMFTPADALAKLSVQLWAVSENLVQAYKFADFGLPAAGVNTQVVLPDDPVQVQIVNTDAGAAHTYDMALVQVTE